LDAASRALIGLESAPDVSASQAFRGQTPRLSQMATRPIAASLGLKSQGYSPWVGSTLTISLLGRFAVAIDDRELPAPAVPHRPAAAVVKMLALAPAHRLPSEVLIEHLWPELPADRGGANLRKAVHFARRALGSEEAIDTRADAVAFWPSASIVVDAARFEATARAALATHETRIAAAAAELYAGELLPDDRYASWTDAPRERLRELALAVYKVARQWERALEIDPLDEEAHRGRMRDQLERGNRQAAIQQFERLRAALREELGVPPDPQTVAVYEEVLASERPEPPTPAQRARALLAWGMVHWERRELDEAERTAREAWALAVDAGLGGELGEASALIGTIAQARGRWRDFFRDELVGSLRRTPQLAPFVFDANLCLSEFCLYLPDGLPEMASYAEDLKRTAVNSGSVQGHALASLVRGEVELLSGDLTSSELALTEAAAPNPSAGAGSATPLALERLAEAWVWAGQRWKARRILPRALRLAQSGPLAAHLVVRVYGAMVESAANAEAAADVVAAAEGAMTGVEVCRPCSIGFRAAAARRLAEGGKVQAATVHLEAAEQIAAMWPGGPWTAAVYEARALIVRARGEDDAASVLLDEAAVLYTQAGFALHAGRCRCAVQPT
jgi:DNA-binding SARP family transcriptional activator